jgi:DNA repair protein RecO (recombination protein O)
MGQFETEGIILKTYSLAEADKIVLILTEKNGLVRGVAKGAKRLKSKFGGILEPFSVVTADLFQKEERELVSIRNLELRKSIFARASDPLILQKLAYMSELLIEFSPPHDPNERVYKMAKICLETIEERPEMIDLMVLYFEFWLLSLGGYLPNWENCSECKTAFHPAESANLLLNFQLICNRCRKSQTNQMVGSDLRQIFINARSSSPARFIENFGAMVGPVNELSGILKRIINQILNREIVSQKFMITASQN